MSLTAKVGDIEGIKRLIEANKGDLGQFRVTKIKSATGLDWVHIHNTDPNLDSREADPQDIEEALNEFISHYSKPGCFTQGSVFPFPSGVIVMALPRKTIMQNLIGTIGAQMALETGDDLTEADIMTVASAISQMLLPGELRGVAGASLEEPMQKMKLFVTKMANRVSDMLHMPSHKMTMGVLMTGPCADGNLAYKERIVFWPSHLDAPVLPNVGILTAKQISGIPMPKEEASVYMQLVADPQSTYTIKLVGDNADGASTSNLTEYTEMKGFLSFLTGLAVNDNLPYQDIMREASRIVGIEFAKQVKTPKEMENIKLHLINAVEGYFTMSRTDLGDMSSLKEVLNATVLFKERLIARNVLSQPVNDTEAGLQNLAVMMGFLAMSTKWFHLYSNADPLPYNEFMDKLNYQYPNLSVDWGMDIIYADKDTHKRSKLDPSVVPLANDFRTAFSAHVKSTGGFIQDVFQYAGKRVKSLMFKGFEKGEVASYASTQRAKFSGKDGMPPAHLVNILAEIEDICNSAIARITSQFEELMKEKEKTSGADKLREERNKYLAEMKELKFNVSQLKHINEANERRLQGIPVGEERSSWMRMKDIYDDEMKRFVAAKNEIELCIKAANTAAKDLSLRLIPKETSQTGLGRVVEILKLVSKTHANCSPGDSQYVQEKIQRHKQARELAESSLERCREELESRIQDENRRFNAMSDECRAQIEELHEHIRMLKEDAEIRVQEFHSLEEEKQDLLDSNRRLRENLEECMQRISHLERSKSSPKKEEGGKTSSSTSPYKQGHASTSKGVAGSKGKKYTLEIGEPYYQRISSPREKEEHDSDSESDSEKALVPYSKTSRHFSISTSTELRTVMERNVVAQRFMRDGGIPPMKEFFKPTSQVDTELFDLLQERTIVLREAYSPALAVSSSKKLNSPPDAYTANKGGDGNIHPVVTLSKNAGDMLMDELIILAIRDNKLPPKLVVASLALGSYFCSESNYKMFVDLLVTVLMGSSEISDSYYENNQALFKHAVIALQIPENDDAIDDILTVFPPLVIFNENIRAAATHSVPYTFLFSTSIPWVSERVKRLTIPEIRKRYLGSNVPGHDRSGGFVSGSATYAPTGGKKKATLKPSGTKKVPMLSSSSYKPSKPFYAPQLKKKGSDREERGDHDDEEDEDVVYSYFD